MGLMLWLIHEYFKLDFPPLLWLTLADRKAFRCGLKERTGWSATRFRNLSRAFILVSTNSSEKRSTTPFITNFSGSGWRQSKRKKRRRRRSRAKGVN